MALMTSLPHVSNAVYSPTALYWPICDSIQAFKIIINVKLQAVKGHSHVRTGGLSRDASRSLWMRWRHALLNWILVPFLCFACARKLRKVQLFKQQSRHQLIESRYRNIPAQASANQIILLPTEFDSIHNDKFEMEKILIIKSFMDTGVK